VAASSEKEGAALVGAAEEAAAEEISHLRTELARRDPYWPAQLAVLTALLVYFALPDKITIGPKWVVPSLEGVLLAGLVVTTPRPNRPYSPGRRRIAIGLIGLVTAANLASLTLLVHYLVRGGRAGGHALILAGTEIWLTNVLIFALWFWELDRGGPRERAQPHPPSPDFLFPQMTVPKIAGESWRPNFVDYLYTSFTNATAFSPTDTMPLSSWAKLLMLVQSLISLVTLALVAARAVNILS
jgi:uncharacterized membrane protein